MTFACVKFAVAFAKFVTSAVVKADLDLRRQSCEDQRVSFAGLTMSICASNCVASANRFAVVLCASSACALAVVDECGIWMFAFDLTFVRP